MIFQLKIYLDRFVQTYVKNIDYAKFMIFPRVRKIIKQIKKGKIAIETTKTWGSCSGLDDLIMNSTNRICKKVSNRVL